MSEEKSLTVVEQREVSFYEDELTAVRADDAHVYVSVRHLCNALGLARQPQVQRIKRHRVLAEGYAGGIIMIPPGPSGGGGQQTAGLLRVDLVPLWLSGVRTSMVKKEIRPKLERFQVEAAKILWEAFQEGRLTVDPSFEELLQQDTDVAQAYKMALAVVKLARSQLLMEAELSAQRAHLAGHDERLEQIEATLGDPSRHITPEQASQISQAVKAVAVVLTKRSGRNEFGSVYGELYRKFGITGYKLLPAKKFDEAIAWLTQWYQDLTAE